MNVMRVDAVLFPSTVNDKWLNGIKGRPSNHHERPLSYATMATIHVDVVVTNVGLLDRQTDL